jgi:S-DNA-T family DNA segregation ATPase FtsK/SpoIIIE
VGHILIAGMPGSGKTTLTQTIILSLALLHRRSQLMFVIIDPMQRALGHLGQLPHLLWPVIGNASDAVDALDELVQLIEARQLTQTHAPRIVVIVDEIDPLLQLAGSRAPQALARLTQRGRGAGIHIIVCAQKPSLLSWATLTQASFPVRLVGQMANSKEAYAATNLESSGAEKLGGCGDFIGIAQGTLWHFQSAFATPAEGNQLVEQLNNGLRSWDIVPYQ